MPDPKFAKIALGIPPKKIFDYLIPPEFAYSIKIGSRVKVPFRNKLLIGYVIELSSKSNFKFKIKPLINLIDPTAVLEPWQIDFARELSEYYFCSLGEAIETILPKSVREGKIVSSLNNLSVAEVKIPQENSSKPQVLCSPNLPGLFEQYLEFISQNLQKQKGIILIFPDKNRLNTAFKCLKPKINSSISIISTTQKEGDNFSEWLKIKQGQSKVVLGTRSAIFAPLSNLGMIIIDDEPNQAYRQQEKPYYNTSEVAILRSKITGCDIVFGTHALSVELFHKIERKEFETVNTPQANSASIQVVDLRGSLPKTANFISKPLEINIQNALDNKKRVGLFFNRKGFSSSTYCEACGFVFKCERCNTPLLFNKEKKALVCHYCNFTIDNFDICPNCKKGYLSFKGTGVQKVENRLHAIFPGSRIISTEDKLPADNTSNFDILVGTQSLFNFIELGDKFHLSAVLLLDSELNFSDFRSTENAFYLLTKLLSLTGTKLIIQTFNPEHYLVKSMVQNNFNLFYQAELDLRKELKLPPFAHILEIVFKDSDEEALKKRINNIIIKIQSLLGEEATILGPVSESPYKLRSFYRQKILLKAKTRAKLLLNLKKIYANVKGLELKTSISID